MYGCWDSAVLNFSVNLDNIPNIFEFIINKQNIICSSQHFDPNIRTDKTTTKPSQSVRSPTQPTLQHFWNLRLDVLSSPTSLKKKIVKNLGENIYNLFINFVRMMIAIKLCPKIMFKFQFSSGELGSWWSRQTPDPSPKSCTSLPNRCNM